MKQSKTHTSDAKLSRESPQNHHIGRDFFCKGGKSNTRTPDPQVNPKLSEQRPNTARTKGWTGTLGAELGRDLGKLFVLDRKHGPQLSLALLRIAAA